MKFISMFESMTHASVKDCIDQGGKLVFIVKEGDIGKAIGKGGANIKRLEKSLNKKIKIVEYSEELLRFVQNVVAPCKVSDISEEENIVTITPADNKNRELLIGRSAVNLRGFEAIVQRYFEVKEIKVI